MVLLLVALLFLLPATGARRDFDALRRRRKRAGQMFARGKSQAEVVTALGVSRQSASRWYAEWSHGGGTALEGTGRAGRLPKLDATQLEALERELDKGPRAHGYPSDMWTLTRVGQVIERTTGVTYHPGHVWRILRGLGWSRQRPARRAIERDDEAVARWVRDDWPRIKKNGFLWVT